MVGVGFYEQGDLGFIHTLIYHTFCGCQVLFACEIGFDDFNEQGIVAFSSGAMWLKSCDSLLSVFAKVKWEMAYI